MKSIIILSVVFAVASANSYYGGGYGGHAQRGNSQSGFMIGQGHGGMHQKQPFPQASHGQGQQNMQVQIPSSPGFQAPQPSFMQMQRPAPAPVNMFIQAPPAPVNEQVQAPAPVPEFVQNQGPTFVTMSVPATPGSPHQITRFEQNIGSDNSNSVSFDTSNGIHTSDNTQILPGTPNPENPSELWNKIAKSGSYSYTSPEGIPISVSWTADGVNGFRAVSSAIPTPPPA